MRSRPPPDPGPVDPQADPPPPAGGAGEGSWDPRAPLATVMSVGGGRRVAAVDAAAEALGLAPGLTLKAARARAPDLAAAPHDPAADDALRARMLAACRRFTPALATSGSDALLLDVTGCGALHGGEAGLAAAVAALFARAGFALRWGLADTPDLASALARFAVAEEAGGLVAHPGEGPVLAATLPVEALGLSAPDVEALRGLGLRRVADVLARPRGALSSALDGRLGARLDALSGVRPAAVSVELEPPRHLAERRLPQAVLDHHAVQRHVRRLAEALERSLEGRGLGARRLVLDLWGPDGTARRVTVRTPQAVRRARDVAELIARRLELLGEGAAGAEGVDQLRLHADAVEPLVARTGALGGPAAEAGGGFEAFARHVVGRYGEGALQRVRVDPSTVLPEREARPAPWAPPARRRAVAAPPEPPPPAWGEAVLRPLRLFDPPERLSAVLYEAPDQPPARFTWRRVAHTVGRAEGPERLAHGGEGGRLRDYFRVEDEGGRRFWIFREGLAGGGPAGGGQAAPGAEPAWFLHGLFA